MKKNIYLVLINIALYSSLFFMSCSKHEYGISNGFDMGDSTASNVSIDTTDSKPDFSMISKARIFPGLVSSEEKRLDSVSITINLNYKDISNTSKIAVIPAPQFSTGLYAPPGEPIKIIVPAGVFDLTAQIGAWTDDLSEIYPRQREAISYTKKSLYPGINYVRSLLGGNIYINATRPWNLKPTLIFSGAVCSPDFILGETNPSEWYKLIAKSTVPWFEVRSKRCIWTLPTKFQQIYPVNQIDSVMRLWDEIIEEDFNGWIGLKDNPANPVHQASSLPWRAVLDIQLSGGYGHNGYPVMYYMDQSWFETSINLYRVTHDPWGNLHEIGHNYQTSAFSWSILGETTNVLFSYKVSDHIGLPRTKGVGGYSTSSSSFPKFGLDYAASNSPGKNFDTYFGGVYNNYRMLPFLQIYDKYGWDFMPFLYENARTTGRYPVTEQDKKDFLYETASSYVKMDMKSFFDAWGISVSSVSTAKIGALYEPLNKAIWLYDPITKTGKDSTIVFPVVKDNKTWTIDSYDSQESTGEGSNNGQAKFVIDGNANTYWHSQWNGASPAYPHWIVFDMKRSLQFDGLYFINRNTVQRAPKSLEILYSDDKTTWTKATVDISQLQAINTKQLVTFAAPIKARYIKVNFTSSWDGANFMSMAEIGGF